MSAGDVAGASSFASQSYEIEAIQLTEVKFRDTWYACPMPKKVDHEQRRRELAAALRRVVSRGGVESASIRAVAAEAAAAELHITLDGLFLQGLIYAERDPEALREDLLATLQRLRDRLEPA